MKTWCSFHIWRSRRASVAGGPQDRSDDLAGRLRATFIIGADRNGTQDVGFFLDQLVELALRALSPGINDPATARACVDRLEAALSSMAGRSMPSPYRRDDDGRLRVVAQPVTFAAMLDASFSEIARYASVSVLCRLLDAVCGLAASVRRPADLDALLRQAALVGERASDRTFSEPDRIAITERYRAATSAIRAQQAGDR